MFWFMCMRVYIFSMICFTLLLKILFHYLKIFDSWFCLVKKAAKELALGFHTRPYFFTYRNVFTHCCLLILIFNISLYIAIFSVDSFSSSIAEERKLSSFYTWQMWMSTCLLCNIFRNARTSFCIFFFSVVWSLIESCHWKQF